MHSITLILYLEKLKEKLKQSRKMQNREMYCDKAPGVLYRSLRIYNENSK